MAARVAALAALALLGTSCVSANWSRVRRYEVIPEERLAALPEEATLGDCLELLGAPLVVWEDRAGGVAVAYGWFRAKGLGVGVNVPVARSLAASVDYAQLAEGARGIVLFFDADLRLLTWRSGFLEDLVPLEAPDAPVRFFGSR